MFPPLVYSGPAPTTLHEPSTEFRGWAPSDRASPEMERPKSCVFNGFHSITPIPGMLGSLGRQVQPAPGSSRSAVWLGYRNQAVRPCFDGSRLLPDRPSDTMLCRGACLVRQQLVAAWQACRRSQPLHMVRHQQQLRQLPFPEKALRDVQEVPQVDEHRPRRTARGASDCERHFRVAQQRGARKPAASDPRRG